jgi:hypothetical protein
VRAPQKDGRALKAMFLLPGKLPIYDAELVYETAVGIKSTSEAFALVPIVQSIAIAAMKLRYSMFCLSICGLACL